MTRSRTSAIVALAFAVSVTFVDRAAHGQPDPPPATAVEHYERGQVAYDLGRYDEAIAAWEQSYALSRRALLLFNLGQAARLAGDCRRALTYYRAFLRAAPEAEQAADARGFVALMETCVAAATEALPPPPSPPSPPSLPPSPPASPPSSEPVATVTRERPPARRRSDILAASLAGAGTVALAAGLYVGAHAEAEARAISEICASGCEWSALEARDAAARRAETIHRVALGIGSAAVVGGVIVYAVGRTREARPPAIALQPRRGGGLVTLEASW